jgi:hypothetical protein
MAFVDAIIQEHPVCHQIFTGDLFFEYVELLLLQYFSVSASFFGKFFMKLSRLEISRTSTQIQG